MRKRGIVGTFYVNPMTIGHGSILTLEQLKEMHDKMGHVIANHLWAHDAPLNSLTLKGAVDSLAKAKNWLFDKGFADGMNLLAIPYDILGGEWSSEYIVTLSKFCTQMRDVSSTGLNCSKASSLVSAVESNRLQENDFGDVTLLHYFHGNKYTSNAEFIDFLDKLSRCDIDITSMLEIANCEN